MEFIWCVFLHRGKLNPLYKIQSEIGNIANIAYFNTLPYSKEKHYNQAHIHTCTLNIARNIKECKGKNVEKATVRVKCN